MAYRILKNAGYLPPKLQQLNDLADLEKQVFADASHASDAAARRAALKLRLLQDAMRGDMLALNQYREQLLARIAAADASSGARSGAVA